MPSSAKRGSLEKAPFHSATLQGYALPPVRLQHDESLQDFCGYLELMTVYAADSDKTIPDGFIDHCRDLEERLPDLEDTGVGL